MKNIVKLFFLLENKTYDISMFENNDEEKKLSLQDPYDSVLLKVIAIFSYFVGLLSSAVMFAFIKYENGHHGNFRTVINQLISNLYAMVSKYLENIPLILPQKTQKYLLSFNMSSSVLKLIALLFT